jgi:hypothetical protein
MFFRGVLEHFVNLLHVKKIELVFRAGMHYFGVQKLRNHFPPNAFILIARTNNGVCECFGGFRKPSKL